MQTAMLETIIQQVEPLSELRFGQLTRLKALCSNHHLRLPLGGKVARQQQRFIAVLGRRPFGVYHHCLGRCPSVTARQHVERDPSLQEMIAEELSERRFAGSAYAKVSDAHNRAAQTLFSQNSAVVERVAYADAHPEQRGERVHRSSARNDSIAIIVRSVAPDCARITS